MHSPDRTALDPRAVVEWFLRLAAIAVLVWYLAYMLSERRRGVTERASSATLRTALERWSTSVSPACVHVDLAHPPAGDERDWLAALRGASTTVEWSGPSLLPTAIADEPRADPVRSADVSVAAPNGVSVMLADTLGMLDSARATTTGVHAVVYRPQATVDAVVNGIVARATRRDSLALKRLLVLGMASWETKFTVAALEERGWTVDARMAIAPKRVAEQGPAADIDTSRYSAVLAIDSTAAPYGDRIARFVRAGGGVVLWPAATTSRALAAIAPGGSGATIEDDGSAPSDSAPRLALALVPITPLVSDATVLERRGDAVSLAARRVGLGRVIETGYPTSWRWRMAGGDDAPDRHREWLAGLVASVAYVGRTAIASPPTDVAPLASLIDHLGPPASRWGEEAHDPARVSRWVFAVVCVSLVLEWASRRTRGLK